MKRNNHTALRHAVLSSIGMLSALSLVLSLSSTAFADTTDVQTMNDEVATASTQTKKRDEQHLQTQNQWLKANERACKQAQLDEHASKPEGISNVTPCRAFKGHTDIFAGFTDASGKFVIGSRGDEFAGISETGKRYDTRRVVFEVPKQAMFTVAEAPGEDQPALQEMYNKLDSNKRVWNLPQTQDPHILWAGFAEFSSPITWNLEKSEVPKDGDMYMVTDSGRKSVLGTAESMPKTLTTQDHSHHDWYFTRPGLYKLTMTATATVNGIVQTDTQTYTFNVSDKSVGSVNQPGSATEPDDEEDDDEEESEGFFPSITIIGNNNTLVFPGVGGFGNQGGFNGSQGNFGTGGSGVGNGNTDGSSSAGQQVTKCSTYQQLQGHKMLLTHGHMDVVVYTASNGLAMAIQEDVSGSHQLQNPASSVFVVGDNAKVGNLWRIPQTQKEGVPWLGWDTNRLTPHAPVRLVLESVEGPGSVRVWMYGGLGRNNIEVLSSTGNNVFDIMPATHGHANWDFSAPGYYTLRLRAISGNAQVVQNYHFAVGVDPQRTPMACDTTAASQGSVSVAKPSVQQKSSAASATRAASSFAYSGGSGFSSFARSRQRDKKKLAQKALKRVRRISLKTPIKSAQQHNKTSRATGIIGLFVNEPIAAYSLLGFGLLLIAGVGYAGYALLRKRGLL